MDLDNCDKLLSNCVQVLRKAVLPKVGLDPDIFSRSSHISYAAVIAFIAIGMASTFGLRYWLRLIGTSISCGERLVTQSLQPFG
jgi:hypothetical protein